jgi:hypothetical protein
MDAAPNRNRIYLSLVMEPMGPAARRPVHSMLVA